MFLRYYTFFTCFDSKMNSHIILWPMILSMYKCLKCVNSWQNTAIIFVLLKMSFVRNLRVLFLNNVLIELTYLDFLIGHWQVHIIRLVFTKRNFQLFNFMRFLNLFNDFYCFFFSMHFSAHNRQKKFILVFFFFKKVRLVQ